MRQEVKVSIIVPVFNSERYLAQSINSLAAQTLQEIEILLIDDGSTDGSHDMLEAFAATDMRVSVFTQMNSGAAAARNNGLHRATGEFILFLDADDIFEPDMAETLYEQAKVSLAQICICRGDNFHHKTGAFSENTDLLNESLLFGGSPFSAHMVAGELFQFTTGAVWNKLFERSFVLNNGFEFQHLPCANDMFFTYSNMALAQRITTVSKCLVHYRTRNEDSITHKSGESNFCYITALSAIMNVLLDRGIFEEFRASFVKSIISNTVSVFSRSSQTKVTPYAVRVSVIVPVFNTEKFLRECLDSVLDQSFSDLELICIDDGSTDTSANILEEYAKKDARVVVLSQPNGGLSVARNTGLSLARGEFCLFLDSDDSLQRDALERLYQKSSEEQLDILFFSARNYADDDNVSTEYVDQMNLYFNRSQATILPISGYDVFLQFHRNDEFCVSACVQFLRTEFLIKKHLHFYPGLISEDELFTVQSVLSAQRVGISNDKFYIRRLRSGSISLNKQRVGRFLGLCVVRTELARLLERGALPFEVQEALRIHIQELEHPTLNDFKTLSHQNQVAAVSSLTQYQQLLTRPIIQLDELERLRSEISEKNKILTRTHAYMLYRIGRVITIFPRKLRGGIRCYRDHGLQYTIKRANYHVRSVFLKIIHGLYQLRHKIRLKRTERNLIANIHICVSVIIPVYNAEKYLRKCLNSIFRQNDPSVPFEVICIDDGSTDSTRQILAIFQEKHPNLKVLHQPNLFAGCARNRGISEAVGEYLMFVDADDFIDPNAIRLAYLAARSERLDVLLYCADLYDDANHRSVHFDMINFDHLPKNIIFSGKDIPNTIFQIAYGAPWNKLMRTSFIRQNQIRFSSGQNSEDNPFVYGAFAAAKRISVLPKVLYYWRSGHNTNISNNQAKDRTAYFQACILLKNELDRMGVFQRFERSYVCVALSISLFSLRSFGSPEIIFEEESLFLERYQYELGIANRPKSYFVNCQDYEELQDIIRRHSH